MGHPFWYMVTAVVLWHAFAPWVAIAFIVLSILAG